MPEIYNADDMGILVNETNQAVAVYKLATKIPLRSKNRGKLALDLTLTASKVRLSLRASSSTTTWQNGTKALLDVDEITTSGYYEITIPTIAFDLELEHETLLGANGTKIAVVVAE